MKLWQNTQFKTAILFCFLVFTKSVDSNFRAFWLTPVTRNILGYSLFCDHSQDDVSFRDIFERRNLSNKCEAFVQTNTKKATNFGLLLFTGMYKTVFVLNLQQNGKNVLDKISEMFVNCNKLATKWRFKFTKSYFFHFYPNDLVNTKTAIPLRVGEQR